MRILTSHLSGQAGISVTLQGWLHKRRDLGSLVFVVLRDRGGLVQIVVKDAAEQAKLDGLQNGTVLTITGTATAEPRAVGGIEIHDPTLEIITPVRDVMPIEIDKPIDHKSENFDTLFENRVISLRNVSERAIFKVQAGVGKAIRAYLEGLDFVEIHTPKLLAGATEGGAEVFKTDYFGQDATLAQSPQFYKQIMTGALERVYEIAPVYRAEPSVTTRHMSEYVSVDAEFGFIDFNDLLELLSGLLGHIVDATWEHNVADLELLGATKPVIPKAIPQLTIAEVHDLYSQSNDGNTRGEKDLFPYEERWICDYAARELGSEAVFVTEWPVSEMKFYHYADPERPELAVRADLLFRGVEIVTGSMREHRYDNLLEQIRASGGDPDSASFKYFVSAFKFGMPPHGGFGMGLERVTQLLIGLSSVKEASLFPRDTKRLSP